MVEHKENLEPKHCIRCGILLVCGQYVNWSGPYCPVCAADRRGELADELPEIKDDL